MNRKEKAELKAAVLLIYFRTDQPSSKTLKYVSYRRIAKVLNLTYNEV